jgi:hypothetical protein
MKITNLHRQLAKEKKNIAFARLQRKRMVTEWLGKLNIVLATM